MAQVLYSVTTVGRRVDAWSTVRLPFEPKGLLLDYRDDLQRALRSLRPSSTSILYAEYGRPDRGFADLENVLLYNLGTGCYGHLARRGIVCRRSHSIDHLHRLTYFLAEPSELPAHAGQLLASVQLAGMPNGATAAHWWAVLRDHIQTRAGMLCDAEFGVEVDVGVSWTRDLAPAIKTFLDGLVAAMHVHDGSERELVSSALSAVGDGDRLWVLLNNPEQALLGRRRLVRPHGAGIAWNPADELCGYFAFRRGSGREAVTASVMSLNQ